MNDSVILNGRYKCIKKIGTGGMSSVFLCHDNRLNKLWAMKVCNVRKDTDQYVGKQEIDVLKSLDFPHIPTIIDAFIEAEKACIVTEYIEGENLKDIIKREGRIPYLLALSYFDVLVDALIYLHSQSPPILYLDMKPSNIMIRNDGELFLIDFGIARKIMCGLDGYGSVGYSPPEQYSASDTRIDGRSDVFALGMTMYEVLTGIPPDTDLITQRKNISKNRLLNKHIKQLILKCTNPDISHRPDAEELKRELTLIKKEEKRVKGALFFTLLTLVIVITLVVSMWRYVIDYQASYRQEQYIEAMLSESSAYMENGIHTRESLNVIAGYLNGNVLSGDNLSDFTYEVARAYFINIRDYYLSLRYFRKLNGIENNIQDKYPDACFYIELCEVITDFSSKPDEVKDVIARFEEFNKHINDKDIKTENERVIKLLRTEYGI